jgi:hypothetical protein
MKLRPVLLAAAFSCPVLVAPAYADPPAPPSVEIPYDAVPSADAVTSPASDGELAKRVKAAMSANGTTRGLPIKVAVVEGVVRLTGTVASGVQVDQAQYVAGNVPGVREVNNKLRPKHDS